jgi:hypothetical protein
MFHCFGAIVGFSFKNIFTAEIGAPIKQKPEQIRFLCLYYAGTSHRLAPYGGYNEKSKEWKKAFEGLSIGIQPEPAGLLDLHTINFGLDFTVDNCPVFEFNEQLKKTIKDSEKEHNIIIPYQHFLHLHASPLIKSFYTIDKTNYFDFANILFDNQYITFPKEECTMFDTPLILKSIPHL